MAASARATSPVLRSKTVSASRQVDSKKSKEKRKGAKLRVSREILEQRKEECGYERFQCAGIGLPPKKGRELALQNVDSHEADDRLVGIE